MCERARDAIEPQEASGRAFAVSATTPAAIPAEATTESTSAVLRHSQVQITLKPPHRASHRADEVENVVLIACCDQLAKQAYCWRASRRTRFALAE